MGALAAQIRRFCSIATSCPCLGLARALNTIPVNLPIFRLGLRLLRRVCGFISALGRNARRWFVAVSIAVAVEVLLAVAVEVEVSLAVTVSAAVEVRGFLVPVK